MRSLGVTFWFLLVCLLSCNREMKAQDLQVVVLDALDGRPQAHVEVEYFCTGIQHNSAHKRAVTNNEGSTMVSNFCIDQEEIEISIYPPGKKEQCGVGPITLK